MICPKCHNILYKDNNTYKCSNNHSYDISKHGYLNLLLSKPNAGDNSILVKARDEFLSKGFYIPLLEKIKEIIFENKLSRILDCGCGTGYYTRNLSDTSEVIGLDISKESIIHASKHDKKSFYIVSSSASIPFQENYFDGVCVIFSPLFPKSIASCIKNDGLLIVVRPGREHLYELKEKIYDNPYYNDDKEEDSSPFILTEKKDITYQKTLNNNDLTNLFTMTPYYYKTRKEDIKKLEKKI